MKQILSLLILLLTVSVSGEARTRSYTPRKRYSQRARSVLRSPMSEYHDAQLKLHIDSLTPRIREPQEIIAALDTMDVPSPVPWNPFLAPLTFSGYVPPYTLRAPEPYVYSAPVNSAVSLPIVEIVEEAPDALQLQEPEETPYTYVSAARRADYLHRIRWARQQYMLSHPEKIEFALWLLPPPPQMPEEDYSFEGYMKRLKIPAFNTKEVVFRPNYDIRRYYWLHTFNGGVQFSQAYLSPNWYQGGNDYLALLVNFYWNVKLNQSYNPKLLFENTISYKLGLNSRSDDQYHKYSVSEDLFQWNMNFGYKAHHNWYYSLTTQFKTQLINNYPQNSQTRTAAFLSPAELNVGFGMTYTATNKSKSLKFKSALSPVSYNLKMCLDHEVDPTQFGIKEGRRLNNEIGSSAELTLEWALTGNIQYRSRMFIFSDYKNYTHDWENTLQFSINRFLSTQIYAHLRYDTASTASSGWRHWMLKEILSFGFAYAFSTK